LNGFENIAANNGWVMAATGASIVFCGLAVLSLVISQLNRVLSIFDGPSRQAEPAAEPPAEAEKPEPLKGSDLRSHRIENIQDMAQLYQPLVDRLEETFELAALHRLANESEFPHPHLSITCMREAKILLPQGDGTFRWSLEEKEK
jgi:hypothetical protein